MKTALTNASILTMENPEIIKGDIIINDSIIEEIGVKANNFDREIDCTDCLVMPGLINCHTHIGMSLFRNYADDLSLMDWLEKKIWPLEDKLRPKDVYIASLISIAEMIKNGTTTFADMYFLEKESLKAIEESKIRCQLAKGLTNINNVGMDKLEKNIELYRYNKHNSYVQIAMGPHAVYTNDLEFLKTVAETNKTYKMPMHIHLSETLKENEQCMDKYGKTPTEFFLETGIFDSKTIAAHGLYLSDSDIQILKEKDVSIIHCPSSNLKLASGFLDVTRLIDSGINVALGTDSAASNNHLSILKEMNLTSLVSKMNNPTNLKSFDVLKMATVNGAYALGLDKEIGVLKRGYEADLIVIDLKNPNHIPKNNLISSLIYSTYENDIRDVIIRGEIVYRNRAFTQIDIEKILKTAQQYFEELIENVGN